MPPSKMGFPPGIEITLDNALKIIMVKSANDISVAIAEGVGGSVEGFADGMKTGFICASGFNVVASATRNGRRLITVVMGSSSAAERTIKAAALFDHGFNAWGLGAPTVEQLPASNVVNAPNMRPVICERR